MTSRYMFCNINNPNPFKIAHLNCLLQINYQMLKMNKSKWTKICVIFNSWTPPFQKSCFQRPLPVPLRKRKHRHHQSDLERTWRTLLPSLVTLLQRTKRHEKKSCTTLSLCDFSITRCFSKGAGYIWLDLWFDHALKPFKPVRSWHAHFAETINAILRSHNVLIHATDWTKKKNWLGFAYLSDPGWKHPACKIQIMHTFL